jgi:6-phosphogluconolactonase/glucosamine-6-phosphate isomerase/deaminase
LTIKTPNNVAQKPKDKKKPKDFIIALTGGNILLIFHQEMWKDGRNMDSENTRAVCSKKNFTKPFELIRLPILVN